MPTIPTDRLLTVGDVAQRLAVSRDWVYSHRDELAPVRVGGLLRFDETGIRHYVDAHREGDR